MKNIFVTLLALSGILLSNCNNNKAQEENSLLNATEFSEQIKQEDNVQLLDVRTSGEFAGGHIEGAVNYDWNGNKFEQQIANLDKSEPVYIYCLSGGRSNAAANHLRKEGYTVHELSGGMMKWRAAKLPEVSNTMNSSSGLTIRDLDAMMHPEKLVVVDFYAEWCGPCKRMEPYLNHLEDDYNQKVQLIRIDADKNPELMEFLKISSLPVIHIYVKKDLNWDHLGYLSEADLKKEIDARL